MIVRRVLGAVLLAIAVAVAAHTVAEPLYHTSTPTHPYSPVWDYMNPFIASGIAIGTVTGAFLKHRADKREKDGDGITWDRLSSNALFFGFAVIGIMFFWNWGIISNLDSFVGVSSDTVSLVWIIIDSLFPVLAGAMGAGLLRGKDG